MIYHSVFLICFVFIVFLEVYSMSLSATLSVDERREKRQALEKKLYFLIIVYMIFWCGFRAYGSTNYIGIDTRKYFYNFTQNARESISEILEINDEGYALFGWILAKLNCDFVVLMLIGATVYIGAVGILIYKYSKDRWMSLFIFVGLNLYFFGFSAIRQGMAMGICIGAYLVLQKVSGLKGVLAFLALVWIASTFHASAIIFLPVCIIQKISFKPKTVFLFLGIAALTMLFKSRFSNLLIQLAAETSDKYQGYEKQYLETATAGTLLYLFVFMTVILRLLTSGEKNDFARNDNMVYLLLTMLILFPGVQGGGAIMRIYYYYYIFIVIYLPNVLESIEDYKTRQISKLLLIGFLLYFYFNINFESLKLIPYQFFWQRINF